MPLSTVIRKRQTQSGFSLIEITIVLVIGGLLFAMFGNMLLNSQKESRVDVTKEHLKAVDEAIRNYSMVNYRLPCVARRDSAPDNPNFAVELADCSAAVVGNQTRRATNPAAGGKTIRIGTVPTRTLNLPDSYGFDGWGSRILYAVVEEATTIADFSINQTDAIGLIDGSSMASVITPAGSLAYLVLSHGENKRGAFNMQGQMPITCSGAQRDVSNCNDDHNFTTTMLVSDANTAEFFDDYVYYAGNARIPEIPSRAIVAFNENVCPPGWTAVNRLQGRLILGTGENTDVPNNTPPDPDPVVKTYTLGESDDRTNSALPYASYLYCEKL